MGGHKGDPYARPFSLGAKLRRRVNVIGDPRVDTGRTREERDAGASGIRQPYFVPHHFLESLMKKLTAVLISGLFATGVAVAQTTPAPAATPEPAKTTPATPEAKTADTKSDAKPAPKKTTTHKKKKTKSTTASADAGKSGTTAAPGAAPAAPAAPVGK
jgi:hypothetical protein